MTGREPRGWRKAGPSSPGCELRTRPPLSTGRRQRQQGVQKLGPPRGAKPCRVQREAPSARPNLFWDRPRPAVPRGPSPPPRSRPAPHLRPALPPPRPEQPGPASRSVGAQRRLRMTVPAFQKRLVFKRITSSSFSNLQVTKNFHTQHHAVLATTLRGRCDHPLYTHTENRVSERRVACPGARPWGELRVDGGLSPRAALWATHGWRSRRRRAGAGVLLRAAAVRGGPRGRVRFLCETVLFAMSLNHR